jgi:NRPS condensation-like uncharacterized protein
MKPLGCFKQFIIYLLSPFLILQTVIPTMFQSQDYNAISNGEPLSGEKACGINMDLPIKDIKEYCKNNKCTVNDYCSALLGTSLYKYFDSQKQKQEKENKKVIDIPRAVHIAIPFSLR